MSINLSGATVRTQQDEFNPINTATHQKSKSSTTSTPSTAFVLPDMIIGEGFHAGSIDYKQDGLAGYNGIGLNQYGLYGIDDGTATFLLAAKGFTEDNWGTVTTGTMRIGTDVSATGIADTTNTFLVFDPFAGTMELNNASLIFRDSTHFVGINATGISGGISNGAHTFFLSNTASTPTGYAEALVKGEFRIGSDVQALATTDFRYLPGVGLSLVGNLLLTGTETAGIPSSYIGIVDGDEATYISKDGLVIKADGNWQAFLLGAGHTWTTSTSGAFYVGTGYDHGVTLGTSYIYFNGTSLDIKSNIVVADDNYIWAGTPTTDGCGISDAGIIGVKDSIPIFLLAADDIADDGYWVGVSKGEFRLGSDVRTTAGTDLLFDGTFQLTGDLNITSGSAVRTGSESGAWSALDSSGFASGAGGAFTFLVSNTIMDLTDDTVAGELRIGSNVDTIAGSSLRFTPVDGLFFKGSLLVDGYVHSGKLFKSDNTETAEANEVVYYSGCGINKYASYGINAVIDELGNHTSSVAQYLLAAKSAVLADDQYWGTEITQGEFRVGDDVAKISATELRGDKYFWFDGSDFRLKGINLSLSPGNSVWVGTATTDGCGFSDVGIIGVKDSIPMFLLAADDIVDDGYWVGVGKGDIRLGGNTKTAGGSTLVYDNSASTLKLRGDLILTEDDSSTPFIRLGNEAAINCGYLSSNALAFYGTVSGKVNVLLGTSGHGWLSETEFRLGSDVENLTTGVSLRYSSAGLTLTGDINASSGSLTGLLSIATGGGVWVGTFPNGCGIGSKGIAGASGSVPKFYLTAATTPAAGIYPAQNAGEFKVGKNIRSALSSSNYGLYVTTTGCEFSGASVHDLSITGNLTLSSGGAVIAGTGSLGSASWSALDNTGFAAGTDSKYTLLLSNNMTLDGMVDGEVRFGEDVSNISTSTNYFQYAPSGVNIGVHIKANGIDISPGASVIGGTDITLSNLGLTGNLTLATGGSVITGSEAGNWSAMNYTGFAAGTVGKYTLLISNTAMAVTTPTVAGEVRFGEDVGDIANSNNYFRYTPLGGVVIKINGDDVTDLITAAAATTADWSNINIDASLADFLKPSQDGVAVTGLNANDHYFGYNSGTPTAPVWKVKIDNSGRMYLGSSGVTTNHVYWSGDVLEIKGTVTATSGFISGNFYVGSSSSGILIDGDAGTPYIKSYIQTGGETGSGWAIYNNGDAYFNKIYGIGSWLTIESGVGRVILGPTTSSFYAASGGYQARLECAVSSSYAIATLYAYTTLYLGGAESAVVEIAPTSTGRVEIGYSSTSGNRMHIGTDEVGLYSGASWVAAWSGTTVGAIGTTNTYIGYYTSSYKSTYTYVGASTALRLGYSVTPSIYIEPSSSGYVYIGTGSSDHVRVKADYLSFFSGTPVTKQTINLDSGFSWNGATTAAGNRADIDTLYTMLWEACNKLKLTTLVNFTEYA